VNASVCVFLVSIEGETRKNFVSSSPSENTEEFLIFHQLPSETAILAF